MKFQLPQLPWAKDALQGFMSADQIETHYSAHHQAYVTKLNKAVEDLGLEKDTLEKIVLNQDGGVFNNAAQAWNHTFFWLGFKPGSSTPKSDGDLGKAIQKSFGGMDGLKEKFMNSATTLFGSGWTWIVSNEKGDLQILNTHNADNPLRFEKSYPLWTCDIWEHAYYVDYRNKRPNYLENAWKYINWDFVAENFRNKQVPNMTRYMTAEAGAHKESHA